MNYALLRGLIISLSLMAAGVSCPNPGRDGWIKMSGYTSYLREGQGGYSYQLEFTDPVSYAFSPQPNFEFDRVSLYFEKIQGVKGQISAAKIRIDRVAQGAHITICDDLSCNITVSEIEIGTVEEGATVELCVGSNCKITGAKQQGVIDKRYTPGSSYAKWGATLLGVVLLIATLTR